MSRFDRKFTGMDCNYWDFTLNGSDTSKVLTVSELTDARLAVFQLMDPNYERIFCKITATQTQLTITTNVPLPAGLYRVVAFQKL